MLASFFFSLSRMLSRGARNLWVTGEGFVASRIMDAPESEASAAVDGDATLDSELGGTSFDELISQCAALKIVMEPSIPEELSAIKRKNAGRKRERQLKHALRKRICYAIDNARASARESTSGADAENEPDEEEWRQRLASFDFYNIPIASAFDFYNCVGIVPGINALAARTEAHAIAVLLYARQHIVRPLAVDGSAMRAIAAVLVVEKLDSHSAECDGVRELAGLGTVAALAARFGTTTQQIAKYRDLLGHCGYHGGRQSKCSNFCPHFGWGTVVGPGLGSGCPCPICMRTCLTASGADGSCSLCGADFGTDDCSCQCVLLGSGTPSRLRHMQRYGQPGSWASQKAHFEHLDRMGSQPQTVEDFCLFLGGEGLEKPSGDEAPEERRRRLMHLFRRVQKAILTGPLVQALALVRETDDSPVPLYPRVTRGCLGDRVQRWGMQNSTTPQYCDKVMFPGFLVLHLDVEPSAVEAALEFQPPRPIFNADGSLSEFPFVLTWFSQHVLSYYDVWGDEDWVEGLQGLCNCPECERGFTLHACASRHACVCTSLGVRAP